MARPKKYEGEIANCSFKLEKYCYEQFKDFSLASGESMNDLIVEFVKGLVKANSHMIEDYRARKSLAVKAIFAPSKPETPTKKSARATKKKSALPETVTSDGSDAVEEKKVGDS